MGTVILAKPELNRIRPIALSIFGVGNAMAAAPNARVIDAVLDHSLETGQVEGLIKLQAWTQRITSILDLDLLIDQVVNHVSYAFGCVEANVYMHDAERSELELVCIGGCTLYQKGHRFKVGKEGMVGHVAMTGRMHYAPDVRVDPYYMACEEATLSEVAIPLIFGDEVLGVFSASHPELNAFPPEQLQLLQVLCGHIAVAVHNCNRFEQEQRERQRLARDAEEARAIQQALLPKASPYVPGFEISGLSVPAGDVGGDWYDFIPFDDGRWGLVLADVSGKGTAAALLMSATRGMLRSLASACSSPAEVLTRLNELMVVDFPSGKFVTLIYAVLDPVNRTLRFANAGHPSPLLVDGRGARFLESETGIPLGVSKSEFSEREITLSQGSRVVLYSDGISEATGAHDEEYGANRLREHAVHPDVSTESVLADVRRHGNGAELQDDATVIVIRVS
jgi:phosphoserine phosphatase RsbU/P